MGIGARCNLLPAIADGEEAGAKAGRKTPQGRHHMAHDTPQALIFVATIVALALWTDARERARQVSRNAREKLSNTGLMMYSKNVRSPVLM
jgi:hypothetical protein